MEKNGNFSNLETDKSELVNLTDSLPDKTAELAGLYNDCKKSTK